MKKVNLADLRSSLTSFIRYVQRGGEVIIQRRNIAVAKLVPIETVSRNRTRLGCGEGTAQTRGDLTEALIPLEHWEMYR